MDHCVKMMDRIDRQFFVPLMLHFMTITDRNNDLNTHLS